MTARPSIARLTVVELRKAVDTRAGRWLLAAVGGLSVVAVGLYLALDGAGPRTLGAALDAAQIPVQLLLPVIGVLAMTSEWSQRTALATFALVPRRERVIGAKALACGLLVLAVVLTAEVVGLAGFAVGGLLDRTVGGWTLVPSWVGRMLFVQVLSMAMGAALGLMLLASALAIVIFFVAPTALTMLVSAAPRLADPVSWFDLGRALAQFLGSQAVTGEQWLHLLSATAVWVVLPAAAGVLRVRRAEVA